MPLLVFTQTLIAFFWALSSVVGVACGAGADTGPLIRMSPSSVAARSRKDLTGFSSCGFVSRQNATSVLSLRKEVKRFHDVRRRHKHFLTAFHFG